MKINSIRDHFAQPPPEFGPTPFWFLNDELDEQRLHNALEEMKAKGIAGVIIHPRTGMEVEYLSDLFWQKLEFICETLKQLQMKGWIYDEYNWPSGPVGGKLLREHPEFKQVGLDYRIGPAPRLLPMLRKRRDDLMGVFTLEAGNISDKTEKIANGNFDDLHGKILLFFLSEVRAPMFATRCAPWAKGETGYLDVLSPAAVDEFMRLTHLEYDRHLKRYYGSPIVGIFTDEPQNYSAFPYTPAMPDEFRRRFARDFRGAIPSLAGRFAGISTEEHIRNKTNFFELARDLYVQSFFQKLSDWASERGLILTGHLGQEDDLKRLPVTNMSFFGPLSRMHMPGTDILCDRHGYEKKHGVTVHPNFNPKALSSTAHHAGARRTLCEIWGGNGWATSPEKLKSVLNWAQACGVNFINPHAVFMSLRGLRKRDFPSSHFPPQPWWSHYDKFSRYIARLSLTNSSGAHKADVLFAFPMKSLWAGFDLRAKRDRLADFLEATSLALLRHQLDFDYLFDEVVESGEAAVKDDKIHIGEEQYSALLLPLATVIPVKLLGLAEQFAGAGGPVIAFGYETPTHDEYGCDVSERVKTLLDSGSVNRIVHRKLGTDGNADVQWLTKAVAEHIRPDIIVKGDLARNMIYLHRTLEDADIYFIANLSEEEGTAEIEVRCKGRPQEWNPESGEIRDVLAYRDGLEYTGITTRFHPNEARFYVFTDQPPVDHVESSNLNLTSVTTEHAQGYTSALEVRLNRNGKRYTRDVEQAFPPIFLPDRWEIDYPIRNTMLLDAWEVEILSGDKTSDWKPSDDPRLGLRSRFVIESVRGLFSLGKMLKRSFGRLKVPTTRYEPMDELADVAEKWLKLLGIDSAQLDMYEDAEILLKIADYAGVAIGADYPPPGSTFAMSAVFRADHVPEDLSLVYENLEGGPISLHINGSEVKEQPRRTFIWDASNMAVPIAPNTRKGENRIRLEWRQPAFCSLFPSVHGIEPVCLAGTFWVKAGRIVEQKYAVPAMPWSQIGFPDYIGSLTYKSAFNVPISYMAQQLFLKFDRIGSVAEVRINGKPAGVILWRPYALDVTDLIVQGENTIEVTVANTAANLLGKRVPAGLIGKPYIAPYWRHRIRFG